MIQNNNMKKRPLIFWVIGTIFLYFGIFLISGAVSPVPGETEATLFFSNLIGFVFLLVGGMFWISIMHMK